MSQEIADKALDYIFKTYNTDIIGLNFIGGEPLLNIDIIDYICEEFLQRACATHSPWVTNCHFAFISNGLLARTKKVEQFLEKYQDFLAFTITIDGPKEVHDACRLDNAGRGTFEQAYNNWRYLKNKFPQCVDLETKATISPNNLEQINKIIDFFIEAGFKTVHINPIQEHKWNLEEAKKYFQQLIVIADKIHKAKSDIQIDLFNKKKYVKMNIEDNQNYCGGLSRNSITIDPNGKLFTCTRFTSSSLDAPLSIGNIYEGITNQNLLEIMGQVTRRSQSTDKCFYCPIGQGCGYCSAYNYQINGDFNKRNTNTCLMHKAAAIANSYFYGTPLYLSKVETYQIAGDKYEFHFA